MSGFQLVERGVPLPHLSQETILEKAGVNRVNLANLFHS